MDIDVLKTFVAVAECGGFSKAEERVHRTQSTISQQIARLEKELGVVLFDRRNRTVRLSDPGERYLGYARRIVALDREARTVVGRDGEVTVVRLGVAEDFAAVGLPEVLGRFAAANPAIRLEVLSAPSEALRGYRDGGRIDLSIAHELDTPNDALGFGSEKLSWIGDRFSLNYRERPVPLVVYPQGCAYRNRAISTLEAAGIDWRIAYEIPHWSGIRSAVQSGLGVTVLKKDSIADIPDVRALDLADGLPDIADVYLTLRARETPCRGVFERMAAAIAGVVFTQEGAGVVFTQEGYGAHRDVAGLAGT
ncbi:LysR substrate-binding domain-containing protein [Varunaivibrio sulfuroxidans]|uniref:LysR family transcriptional regulator n=1 Tax=Varunaivibrio sulfuroxidans TaxID=1773489 RepID=A0A4R3JCG0_9PROT|nr:LysR substrate-binding domain-containing protein [Varunaivibrio sulfuroxidans]TCS63442.1 LysR family transcriptional regulator [Varunaivibrio sulfuroxidans]WES30412.1 LysR substrate-binding domain-containing protein [Varunaivibrio sulfuroxidans]